MLGLPLLACSSGTSAPVEDDAGVDAGRSNDADLAVDEPGRYRVALEVTDDQGARDECDPIEFHVLDK